jgi:Rod binding domain-containing protein
MNRKKPPLISQLSHQTPEAAKEADGLQVSECPKTFAKNDVQEKKTSQALIRAVGSPRMEGSTPDAAPPVQRRLTAQSRP